MAKQAAYNTLIQGKSWLLGDPLMEGWLNDTIWKVMENLLCVVAPKKTAAPDPFPRTNADPKVLETARKILVHNQLQTLTYALYGDKMAPIFDKAFQKRIEMDHQRSEILTQELHWTMAPKLANRAIALRGAAMLPVYPQVGRDATDKFNPRVIPELVMWVPTLATRDEAIQLLKDAGYATIQQDPDHILRKRTGEIWHDIRVRSMLWEESKSWSIQMERAIWDRASHAQSNVARFDSTDLFLLGCRHFAVDSLAGSAIALLDLALLLTSPGEKLDWIRIREVKNSFAYPEWLWVSIAALNVYEKKTGHTFDFPGWVRDELTAISSTFWTGFLDARLCWASPDPKSVDFTRAFVKLTKGN